MASNVREVKITEDPFSKWANSVSDSVRERTLIKSPDFKGYTDSTGTHLNLHAKHKYTPPYMNYVGDWNPSSSYAVNDVVSVYDGIANPLTKVHTELKAFFGGSLSVAPGGMFSVPAGQLWQGSYKGTIIYIPIYTPIPGTYICVSSVPSLQFTADLISTKVVTKDFSTLTPTSNLFGTSVSTYMRCANVNYFPIWPDKSKYGVASIDPDNPLFAIGQYWQLLSLLPQVDNSCDSSGHNVTSFTDTQTQPLTGSLNSSDKTLIQFGQNG